MKPSGREHRYHVRATLAELVPDAERLLRVANVIEDVALGISTNAPAEPLRNAAAVIQASVVDLAVTLIGVASRADRLLFLTARQDTSDVEPHRVTSVHGTENPCCVGSSRACCADRV